MPISMQAGVWSVGRREKSISVPPKPESEHHAGQALQGSEGRFRTGFIRDVKDHTEHPAVKNTVKLQSERSKCLETEKEQSPTQTVTEPNASTPNLI